MMTTLDGYIEGPEHDLSWHNVDDEFNIFAKEQMEEIGTIVFGRRTYQLMESFWPSPQGRADDPAVAELMNRTPKVVFSKTLEKVVETDIWKHVTLIKGTVAEAMQQLKKAEGKEIEVLGSNNLCVTLLEVGLLDELRIMVNPVVIGKGTPLFMGIQNKKQFELVNTRKFKNGNVLLTYKIAPFA